MNELPTVPKWALHAATMYKLSFAGWCIAVALLIARIITAGQWEGRFYLGEPLTSIILMSLALPGVLYMYLQSRNLTTANRENAQAIYTRIMRVQRPAGIGAVAGAILGLLPFLVNFFGILSLFFTSPADFWMNVGMFVPWVALYIFTGTYIVAEVLNKQSRKG